MEINITTSTTPNKLKEVAIELAEERWLFEGHSKIPREDEYGHSNYLAYIDYEIERLKKIKSHLLIKKLTQK